MVLQGSHEMIPGSCRQQYWLKFIMKRTLLMTAQNLCWCLDKTSRPESVHWLQELWGRVNLYPTRSPNVCHTHALEYVLSWNQVGRSITRLGSSFQAGYVAYPAQCPKRLPGVVSPCAMLCCACAVLSCAVLCCQLWTIISRLHARYCSKTRN